MDYRIEAIEVLLNRECIMERYYPLIPYKETLVKNIKAAGCRTKSECLALADDAFGLSCELANLFRRFLVMYDVKDSKMKEAEEALRELYLLPGVKATRARLYFDAGYQSLDKIAKAQPEQIIRDTSELIARKGLGLKAPLSKEVRTHIAVARACTEFSA